MKSKPKPTGPEVCGTAQTSNDEMASKCPLLSPGLPAGICSDPGIPWVRRVGLQESSISRADGAGLAQPCKLPPAREEKRKVKEERDRLGDSAGRSRATSQAAALPLHIPSWGRLGQGWSWSWKCSRAWGRSPANPFEQELSPEAEPFTNSTKQKLIST